MSTRTHRILLTAVVGLVAVAVVTARVATRSDGLVRTAPIRTAAPTSAVTTLSGFPAFAAAVIGIGIEVHNAPSPAAPVVVRLGHTNENGAPTTFLIREQRSGTDGAPWYRVLLPMRPNGSMGWIRASAVIVTGLRYALVIHLRTFRLDLEQDGSRVATFPIGVGTENAPTPAGEYYIKELIQPPNQNTVYGHYVFGLNGFSNVLLQWPGGGVLGIHGTNDPEHSIGRRVSHGCIRLRNIDIERLAAILPLGTPVEVRDD